MLSRILGVLVAAGVLLAIGGADSYAQFGGRGGIFGSPSRGGRGDRTGGTQNESVHVDRPIAQDADSYEQTEHRLLLMEVDLRLEPDQQAAWRAFAEKVLAYARDLSHERVLAGIPVAAGTSIGGLQHIDQTTDLARHRLSELEEIRTAATSLYKTFSPDQRKIADTRIVTMIAPHANLPAVGDNGSKSSEPGAGSARH